MRRLPHQNSPLYYQFLQYLIICLDMYTKPYIYTHSYKYNTLSTVFYGGRGAYIQTEEGPGAVSGGIKVNYRTGFISMQCLPREKP